MTNTEIKEAIKEIVRIKALKEKEKRLRKRIVDELNKRRKNKLQLGGNDFVKLTTCNTNIYDPFELFFEVASEPMNIDGIEVASIDDIRKFCSLISILKGKAGDYLCKLSPLGVKQHQQLSYSVSLDERNSLRGIDL